MIKPWQGLTVFSLMSTLFLGAIPAYPWTNPQKTSLLNSCVEGNTKAGTVDRSLARSYCNCLVDAITRRYPADQFSKNPKTALEELQKNGTLKRCGDQAMNNSTVWTAQHITAEQNACINNVLKAPQNRVTRPQATNFCQCVIKELRARYTPAQTVKEPTKILANLQQSGVLNRCRTTAGIS